jgi:hypothetical protein
MPSIAFALDRIRLTSDPDDPAGVPCPGCRHILTLHQPEPRSPDRLVGTCDECESWFLIHATARLMLRLPGEADLRDA